MLSKGIERAGLCLHHVSNLDMGDLSNLDGRLLVVFDGLCGYCHRAVRWFMKRDRYDRLRFVDSQSPQIARLLERQGIRASDLASGAGSVLAVSSPDGAGERVDQRSEAVRLVLAQLPQPWPVVAMLMGSIPAAIRDFFYGLIARWRHRISGRLESCPIPTPEEQSRFL